jgi:phosphotransferase system enzyme I (PtsI)
MNRDGELPSEDEQFEAYKSAVVAMHGLPVTIRTVDVGADKALERMSSNELRHEHVLNPALGLRAIRWSLSEPAMFRRSCGRSCAPRLTANVKILIPMVAHLSEVMRIVEAVARARQQLTEAGRSFGRVEVGAMIEIPAAALMLPSFCASFDFVSIGTNDLIQYTLAIDRADDAVAHLYDPCTRPSATDRRKRSATPARPARRSVCGEMAGDPAFTELLLAMGLRSFSMHPTQIVAVKERLLATDTQRWAGHLDEILAAESLPRSRARPSVRSSARPRARPSRLRRWRAGWLEQRRRCREPGRASG